MSATASITVRSAGGSLIATIPKEVVEAERLRPGDEIIATFTRRSEILEQWAEIIKDLPAWDRSETRGRDRF